LSEDTLFQKIYPIADRATRNILVYRGGFFRLYEIKTETNHNYICEYEYYIIENKAVSIPLYKTKRIKKCYVVSRDIPEETFPFIKRAEHEMNDYVAERFGKVIEELERQKIDAILNLNASIAMMINACRFRN